MEMKKMKTPPCKSLRGFLRKSIHVRIKSPRTRTRSHSHHSRIISLFIQTIPPSCLKSLLFNYLDVSAESSSFCTHLLKTLDQLQSDHRYLHRIIDAIEDHSSEQISELRSCIILDSATVFSSLNFSHIHDKHSSVLQKLKSSKKRVVRKIKMIRLVNRASAVI